MNAKQRRKAKRTTDRQPPQLVTFRPWSPSTGEWCWNCGLKIKNLPGEVHGEPFNGVDGAGYRCINYENLRPAPAAAGIIYL